MVTIDFFVGLVAGGSLVALVIRQVICVRFDRRRRLAALQNLSQLANDLAFLERGKKQVNVAQIREVLGALGRHLRALPERQSEAMQEAILQRAGKFSVGQDQGKDE